MVGLIMDQHITVFGSIHIIGLIDARDCTHSVLEHIWIKGSYLDQRLPQYESLYSIGLKSARIEILHDGSHYMDFSKTDFVIYLPLFGNAGDRLK